MGRQCCQGTDCIVAIHYALYSLFQNKCNIFEVVFLLEKSVYQLGCQHFLQHSKHESDQLRTNRRTDATKHIISPASQLIISPASRSIIKVLNACQLSSRGPNYCVRFSAIMLCRVLSVKRDLIEAVSHLNVQYDNCHCYTRRRLGWHQPCEAFFGHDTN